MELCGGCGAEVVLLSIFNPDQEQAYERVLRRQPTGTLLLMPHRCRDYLAWHGPADRRDHGAIDVPNGWTPAPRQRQPLAVAA